MKRTVSVLAVAGALMISSAGLAQPIAIVGGTVIDGNGGTPIENGVVIIEGKRITAVGDKSTLVPPGARRISAAGKYVMPGLMDANVHLVIDTRALTAIRYEGRYDELAIEAAQVALKTGVTTVFDSWGPREYLIKAREAINQGRVSGARIYLAGNIVGFGGPYSDDFSPEDRRILPEPFTSRINAIWQDNVGPELLAMSPEQVRKEIREYAKKGIDFIKYAGTRHGSVEIMFSPRIQQVIVEEAHRAGITVQTHTMSGEGVDIAVRAGVDLMQHCDITMEHPIPPETVALVAERRVPCATLPHTRRALSWYRERAKAAPFFKHFALDLVNEKALYAAGVPILLSTDAGVFSAAFRGSAAWRDGVPPEDNMLVLGEGHFIWMLAVEEQGMKPMDALMAATRNIARAYRVDRDLGTLEKGKIADLLVLERNPLEAAANYRSISLVMKEGQVVDRESLPNPKLLTTEPGPTNEGR